MNDVVQEAVGKLSEKLGGGFDAVVKFVIEDEGSIIVDSSGVRVADEEAEVTLTATADMFRAILEGDISPASAFMTGKLSVDGNMGLAMKLSSLLS